MTYVLSERDDRDERVVRITLNRPDRLNVLSPPVYDELFDALQEACDDAAVRAIVLSGRGEHFCAGFDLAVSDDAAIDQPVWEQWRSMSAQRSRMQGIAEAPKPIVAAVAGYCLGGGFELANYCDFIVAADTATFGEPEVRFSLAAHPRLLYFVPLRKAKEIQLLGGRFGAEYAERIGLINAVVPASELSDWAFEFAQRLAELPPETIQHTKSIMDRVLDLQGLRVLDGAFTSDFVVSKLTDTEQRRAFREQRRTRGLRHALSDAAGQRPGTASDGATGDEGAR